MKENKAKTPDAAREAGIITAQEYEKLKDLHRAVREVIEVDSFDPTRLEKTGLNPAPDEPVRAQSA